MGSKLGIELDERDLQKRDSELLRLGKLIASILHITDEKSGEFSKRDKGETCLFIHVSNTL